VLREHTAHNIFVDIDAESLSNLMSVAYTTESRVAPLHLDDGRDELSGRPFGAGWAAIR